jgi:hypothetical protein
MTSLDDLHVMPVSGDRVCIRCWATWRESKHHDCGRIRSRERGADGYRTANVLGEDLGRMAGHVDQAIARAERHVGPVTVRGQIAAMRETTNITAGLVVAVVVIFLLLAATFSR